MTNADVADLDAERTLLGCALVDANSRELASCSLTDSDFAEPTHQLVFQAICRIISEKRIFDKISVKDAIRQQAQIKIEEIMPILNALESVGFASTDTAENCISVVRGKATMRLLAGAAHRITNAALNPAADPTGVISFAQNELRSVLDRNAGDTKIDHVLAWAELERDIFRAKWLEEGLTSPWKELDGIIGGFKPGELIAWAAAPKIGKSGCALTLSFHVAKFHGPVVYFTIEMDSEASRLRLVAHLSGISTRRLRNNQFDEEEAVLVKKAFVQIRKHAPLFYARPFHYMSRIRRVLRETEREYGQIATIIVDHAGCIRDDITSKKNLNQNQAMSAIYEQLRDLAEEYRAPMHVIQHVSREGQKAERPTMAMIRDGGNIEGIAHSIIIPFRPYPKGDAPQGTEESNFSKEDQKTIGEFIVEASREGGEGVLPMRYYGAQNKWVVDTAKIYSSGDSGLPSR